PANMVSTNAMASSVMPSRRPGSPRRMVTQRGGLRGFLELVRGGAGARRAGRGRCVLAGDPRRPGGSSGGPASAGPRGPGPGGGPRPRPVAAGPAWVLAAGRVVAVPAGLAIGPLARAARGWVAWPAVARARVTRTRVTRTPGARRPRWPRRPRLPAATRHG